MGAGFFKAQLASRLVRTPTIESFRFTSSEKIDFIPGQFLKLIFDEKNPENKELNKFLSFSSSPTNNYFEITKRLGNSEFSQRLRELGLNHQVLIQAPFGNCVFKVDYNKIAFLIGGIGITPVISIIEYIANEQLSTDVLLLYSNRNEEEIAFKKELDTWQKACLNIKVIYTVTDCQPKDTSCIYGRIDKDLLLREISGFKERIFFTFGPPKMVEAMQELCLDLGCAKENIKTESFIGY